MAKYVDYKKMQEQLLKRTDGYAANVRIIYQRAFEEIIDLVKGTELEDGKPFSFSDYGYGEEVGKILRSMYSQIYQVIRGGVQKEWLTSNENNDGLVKSVFGEQSLDDVRFSKLFQRNKEAMDAFFARKSADGGLNLSQRVWKYTGMFRHELENTLDLAIGEGTPANRIAAKIKQYLDEPDKWYRRFRVKIGEDEDGNPVYGRKWKRRIWDNESDSYKWIDDNPKDYHPGKGVYRSSARNAQRLARTETNMAYRMADYERWQQLDFVIGIEIKRSNHYYPCTVCESLKGIYPKTFKWKGWHPNCRCFQVPVLAKDDEIEKMLEKILDGESTATVPCDGKLTKLPKHFTDWMDENESRISGARERGTLPYFIRDNERLINPPTASITDISAIPMKKSDLEKWYKENLPNTKNGKRFVVPCPDGAETIINKRFYEECISKYKDDELYNLKLGYAAKSHLLFPKSVFIRNEDALHYANTIFKVYEMIIDNYILEFKCKVDYSGCFLHILRLKKKDSNP